MLKEYLVSSLEETKNLANIIAESLKPGNVILLKGTLGAGKTSFTKFLINKLLNSKNMNIDGTSPTFNIVKEYNMDNNIKIYHFDLYRLKDKNELYELDIENSFENGISIIEWPEIAEDIIYNVKFDINIKILNNEKRLFLVNELQQA